MWGVLCTAAFAIACSSVVTPQLVDGATQDGSGRDDGAIDDRPTADAVDATPVRLRPLSTVQLLNTNSTVAAFAADLQASDSMPASPMRVSDECVEIRDDGARLVDGGTIRLSIDDRSVTVAFGSNGQPRYYYEFGGSLVGQLPLTISLTGNDAFPAWSLVAPRAINAEPLIRSEQFTHTPGQPLRVTWERGRSNGEIVVSLSGQHCEDDARRRIQCVLPTTRTSIEIPSAVVQRITACSEHRYVWTQYRYALPVSVFADAPVQVVAWSIGIAVPLH